MLHELLSLFRLLHNRVKNDILFHSIFTRFFKNFGID